MFPKQYVVEVEVRQGPIKAEGLLRENAEGPYPGVVDEGEDATRYEDMAAAERVSTQLEEAARAAGLELRATPVRCIVA